MTAPAPWLALVGLGEDGVAGLSPTAQALVANAALVVGGRRHLALAETLIRGETLAWHSPLEGTLPAILGRRGSPVCVLASGDPFHYGVGALLGRHVPSAEIRCLPQPSSFSLLAARLGWALQDCACVSLHGRALTRVVPALTHGRQILALSWDGTTPEALAALLTERGFGRSHLHVGEALGGPRERLRATVAASFDLDAVDDLNVVGCAVRADAHARQVPATPGLPDDWFAQDGQITKRPVRALTLAALAPRPGERLWDIGAGSGSIGVEWLLAAGSTLAVAVERDPARAARVARNAATWGVGDRLQVMVGTAPGALAGLPPPDAAFVGGGLTEPGVVAAISAALLPGGRLVANAVTVESQTLVLQLFQSLGGELESLAFARAEPLGGFHGFRPAMPLLQWRWVKP